MKCSEFLMNGLVLTTKGFNIMFTEPHTEPDESNTQLTCFSLFNITLYPKPNPTLPK
jgi:hypothetical protein